MIASTLALVLTASLAPNAPVDDELLAALREIVEPRRPAGARVIQDYGATPAGGVEVVFRHDDEGWISPIGLQRFEAGHVEEMWLASDMVDVVGSVGVGDASHVVRVEKPASGVIAIVDGPDYALFVSRVTPMRELTDDDVAVVVDSARELWGALTGDDVSGDAPALSPSEPAKKKTTPTADPLAAPAPRRDEPRSDRRGASARPAPSSNEPIGVERDAPARQGLARLSRLGDAVDTFRARNGRMPTLAELVDGGLVDPVQLVDPRGPAFGNAQRSSDVLGELSTFRLVDTWRSGPIATSDLPRRGAWLILTGSGEVYEQPVDPAWLGRYEPKRLDAAARDRRLDGPAAKLGVFVSDGATDSGRRGAGVDGIVPGFDRYDPFDDAWDLTGAIHDLRPGDLIVTVNGVRVESVADLDRYLRRPRDARSSTILEVIRDGTLLSTSPLRPMLGPYDAPGTPREQVAHAEWLLGERSSPPPGVEAADGEPKRSEGERQEVLLGMLAMDELEASVDPPGVIGWRAWATGMRQARGSGAALAFLDEWYPMVHPEERPEVDVLRARELRLLGRTDEALEVLDHVERGVRWMIDEELRLVPPEERAEAREWRLARLEGAWKERAVTLASAGRFDEIVELGRRVADEPLSGRDKAELVSEIGGALFAAGAHRDAIELARRAASIEGASRRHVEMLPEIEAFVAAVEAEVRD